MQETWRLEIEGDRERSARTGARPDERLALAAEAATIAQPLVSVVIPTYRRPALLRRCLTALAQQDLPPDRFEIVVAEDGGEGQAARVVAAVRRSGSPAIRYVGVPKSGPAAARNAALAISRGEIVAFTDDDTIPAPDWLRRGLAALQPGIDVVTGKTVVPIDGEPTDYERNVRGLEISPFLTCNLFCRRAALDAVGGFDARFARAYREDSDLQFRLARHGKTMVRDERVLVIHPVRPADRFISLKLQRNQYYDALLYREHPAAFRASIRRRPPWRHYAIALAQIVSVAALLGQARRIAALATAVWLLLSGKFFLERMRPIRKSPGEILDMLVTSVTIPPVAVFWRCRGALAFRVWFW